MIPFYILPDYRSVHSCCYRVQHHTIIRISALTRLMLFVGAVCMNCAAPTYVQTLVFKARALVLQIKHIRGFHDSLHVQKPCLGPVPMPVKSPSRIHFSRPPTLHLYMWLAWQSNCGLCMRRDTEREPFAKLKHGAYSTACRLPCFAITG